MVIIVAGDRVSGAIAKYLSNLEKFPNRNSLDNQSEFKQLIIPGMEEFMEKTNTQLKLTSCLTPRTRQGFKSLANS
jgi:hypothetical protein